MPFLPLLDLSPKFSVENMSNDAPGLITPDREAERRDSRPIRPQASPRDTRPATPISPKRPHVEFDLKLHETETVYLSSGKQSPVRGRTLRRLSHRDRNRSRSTLRLLGPRNDSVDTSYLRERLISRDLTATPEQYFDDNMLEPRPVGRYRTYSITEELERADSMSASSFVSFVGHRDTFALMGVHRLHNRAIYVPECFFNLLVPYLDFETYKALRLSCKFWSQSITRVRPISVRATARLPVEILERIFDDLYPIDFDAARHTCRTWMIASLELSMLTRKLQFGGWRQAAQLDEAHICSHGRKMSMTSGNWLLSKRLATECALTKKLIPNDTLDPRQAENFSRPQVCPLSLSSEVDFSDLGYSAGQSGTGDPPLRFDVSVCQKYLLVSKAHTIFIYALINTNGAPSHEFGGCLEALNIIHCPGRVLAISMNTTSERLSVAALLGDRLGMVFEMVGDQTLQTGSAGVLTQQHPKLQRGSSDGTGAVTEMTVYNADGSYGQHTFAQRPESMAFDMGKRSVYKNVCSAQDPPRSVAICPQRRCVAFGNATGIEVHWIDALSGHDLQRWFPLSSGCGCLYFLTNRIGIDSARKLRIIASAAHPIQTQLEALQYPERTERLNKKGPWDDFTSEDQAWKLNWAFSRMSTARASQTAPEHYNATPLSDGNAILFTDPNTGSLYLGEGRLDEGLPELTRRYRFECPEKGLVPFVYNAGAELQWGVRVLAAYADPNDLEAPKHLYLFTVPPDNFFSDQGFVSYADPSIASRDVVKSISGIHVVDVPSLTALAIDASDGDLTLRAFSTVDGGRMFTWQLAVDKETTHRVVLEDGITIPTLTSGTDDMVMKDADGIMTWKGTSGVFDGAMSPELDADGDTIMRDAPPPPRQPSPPPRRPSTPTPPAPLFFAGSSQQMQEPEDEGYASENDDADESDYGLSITGFAIHVPPIHGDWSGSDEWIPRYLSEEGVNIEDEGLGADLVQATRVDVQIVGL